VAHRQDPGPGPRNSAANRRGVTAGWPWQAPWALPRVSGLCATSCAGDGFTKGLAARRHPNQLGEPFGLGNHFQLMKKIWLNVYCGAMLKTLLLFRFIVPQTF